VNSSVRYYKNVGRVKTFTKNGSIPKTDYRLPYHRCVVTKHITKACVRT